MAEFIFEAVEAKFGDCILIRWGDDHGRIMLIDGGPATVYKDRLEPVIDGLRGALAIADNEALELELVAVSHIDGDHILGIERMLKAMQTARTGNLPEKVAITRFWLNALDDIVTGGEPVPAAVMSALNRSIPTAGGDELRAVLSSVKQGRRTRNLARVLGLPGNIASKSLVSSGEKLSLSHGMEITVVAPASDELKNLRDLWKSTPVPERASLAANIDASIPNLSSIVMHVQRGNATALLTGDARGDLIREALKASDLLNSEGKLHLDVLKVQHHGSKNNMEPKFFAKITADHYVISANGHHHHPSEDTLRAIVAARGGDEYTIHLTNDVNHAVSLLRAEEAKPEHNFVLDVRGNNNDKISIVVG